MRPLQVQSRIWVGIRVGLAVFFLLLIGCGILWFNGLLTSKIRVEGGNIKALLICQVNVSCLLERGLRVCFFSYFDVLLERLPLIVWFSVSLRLVWGFSLAEVDALKNIFPSIH